MDPGSLKFRFTGFTQRIDFVVAAAVVVAVNKRLTQQLHMNVYYLSPSPSLILADGTLNCRLTIFQRLFRAPQRAAELFTELAKIAIRYPMEVLIIKIEDYIFFDTSKENGTSAYSMQKIAEELDSILEASGLKERTYLLSSIKRVPTLEELRKGKNIIILLDIRDPLILCNNLKE